MKKIPLVIMMLAILMIPLNGTLNAHHGFADYWHVHWETNSHPQNVSYEIIKDDLSGGYYDIAASINDWNSSQNKIKLVPWNSSQSVIPQMSIVVDRYADDWYGNASWSNPVWNITSDDHYIWATPRVNSRTIEEAISKGENANLRRKVVTHEIGHNLGLGHPSASKTSVNAIMHQGWNGYSTVQTHDVEWINFRYNHTHSLSSKNESNQSIEESTSMPAALQVDWVDYNSLEELYEQSDIVVIGEVLRSHSVYVKDLPYTVHTIKIQEIINGSISEKEITIGQFGGESPEQSNIQVIDNPLFETSVELVLFLKQVEHGTYNYEVPYDYFVTGGNQGRFELQGEQVINYSDFDYLEQYRQSKPNLFRQEIQQF
ncbi:hypothetical protein EBB07_16575 [Paenibacillaceae bacterium]|nr:hypothetical protein EBB07_16575 [Paenibacillaceae bacterium]